MRMHLTFIALCFIGLSLQAQVTGEKKTMSQGIGEALMLTIQDMDSKTISKLWTDFMKADYGTKTKYDRKNKEYVSTEVDIDAIGQGRDLTIYTRIEDSGKSNTLLSMWIDSGSSIMSADKQPTQSLAAEQLLMKFNIYVEKEKIKTELANEEKNLSKLEDDLKKLVSEKEKAESEIKKAEETIKKAQEAIAKNEKDQAAQQDLIEQQKDQVKKVQDKLSSM